MKRVAISQSNYIPWKGYFDLISKVDEFIIYDEMQYTRRDWRNRNKIKTPQGVKWLTVPVSIKGKYNQKIKDTLIDGDHWAAKHWRALSYNYARAPHFEELAAIFEPVYLQKSHTHLSELNKAFIEKVCAYLDIETTIRDSGEFALIDGKTERLVDLCEKAGASHYVTGPTAKNYIEEQIFFERGITTVWFDYSNYPQYPQLWGEFIHDVTILDLLFNCGLDSSKYMRSA